MKQDDCTHSDEERCVVGTWIVDEVRKAVDMCYGLVDVCEFGSMRLRSLTDTNLGLFAVYVNMFLKLKQESSGYSTWVQSKDKDKYIEDYRRAEGIALDKASTSKNAGQRTLAKLISNLMLGNWAQNQNKTQATIVNSDKGSYELSTSLGTDVTNLIFPNEEVGWVPCKYSEHNVTSGTNVNVEVAAYVTTDARLKLYEYLSKLRQSGLYCDTRCDISSEGR